MAEFTLDIHEQILLRLDVKDLIRFKSVCKSWNSLISSDGFIKAHLNHSYCNDCKTGHRRIFMCRFGGPKTIPLFKNAETLFEHNNVFVIGSHNGLVCVAPFHRQLLVVNPSTREVKKLSSPQLPRLVFWGSACWGFGYDSYTDDYKVIVGFMIDEKRVCFQLLTLKSNVWKGIGEVNYEYIWKIGTLCNGGLHWFMNDQNKKKVIISFDLSKEEFKEIPQPDDALYKRGKYLSLGVAKECLCIYQSRMSAFSEKWVMKNDDVKQPWKRMPYDYEVEYDIVHYLRMLRDYIPSEGSYFHDELCLCKSAAYIGSPIFVQSLVSPVVKQEIEEKEQDRE